MTDIYEILIRGNGVKITGAHVILWNPDGKSVSDPQPLDPGSPELVAVVGELLPAALAERDAALATLATEREERATEAAESAAYREAAEEALAKAGAAISNPDLDDTATVAAVARVVADISTPVNKRKAALLREQAVAALAEAEKLEANPAV